LKSDPGLADGLKQVRGGLLLWEILDRIQAKASCVAQCAGNVTCSCWPSKLKYYLYSTHWDTMVGLLSVLGIPRLGIDRDELPPDSSALLVELWQTAQGQFYVKV
ncbi:Protein PHO-10, partial [Aphelenchoides avenae]